MDRPTLREVLGLILIAAGVACIPLGWIASAGWLVLATCLVILGAFFFSTSRISRKLAEDEELSSASPGYKADIHNYSGWLTGGRRPPNPLETRSTSSSDDADGD